MTKTVAVAQGSRASHRSVLVHRLAVLIAASLAAFVAWLLCVPVMGMDLTVGSGPTEQTVSVASALLVPIIAGAAAWGLLALFERVLRRGVLVWRIVGWTVLALSLLGPASLGRSAPVLIALLSMHVLVGVILIIGLAWHEGSRSA